MSQPNMHTGLKLISSLFSYPAGQNLGEPQPPTSSEASALGAARKAVDPIRLESEYVRLFVNAMPEVPCPPYGSVYLEGPLMGESTLQVERIYRKYGVASAELADHIAVESEFMAWLYGKRLADTGAREDFDYLLDHLRRWTAPFLERVERHDKTGYYRQCAIVSRDILAHGMQ